MTSAAVALAALLLQAAVPAAAQQGPDPGLTAAIREADAQMFDAYNRCDLPRLAAFFAEDLEFYHDQTGLSRGRQAFLDAIKANVCGKVRRDLVPGTLEVYPLHGYGAVEVGEHVFCDPRRAARCDPKTSGIARFTTLWRRDPDGWRVTRVISYDHVSDWQR